MNSLADRLPLRSLALSLLLFFIFLVLAWLHYRLVVPPLDYANKDFMTLWTGGKAILLGLDPYD
ncbi:MAG: hypothetical protein R3272_13450, partial [Candidatus Promineifilaceae bacterium]|nr:hypothetical protein [Candidatus Promineifilaceae bacterium]